MNMKEMWISIPKDISLNGFKTVMVAMPVNTHTLLITKVDQQGKKVKCLAIWRGKEGKTNDRKVSFVTGRGVRPAKTIIADEFEISDYGKVHLYLEADEHNCSEANRALVPEREQLELWDGIKRHLDPAGIEFFIGIYPNLLRDPSSKKILAKARTKDWLESSRDDH